MEHDVHVEPWLRGPLPGVHPLLAPALRAFEQVREDLAKWTESLSSEQIWARPHGLPSVGLQIRHIGGSTERLMTYAMGGQLSVAQLAELRTESEASGGRAELLQELDRRLAEAEHTIRGLDPAKLEDPRVVGRKQLPTTLGGILIHIAEHAQRHTGQAIVTAKLAAQL